MKSYFAQNEFSHLCAQASRATPGGN